MGGPVVSTSPPIVGVFTFSSVYSFPSQGSFYTFIDLPFPRGGRSFHFPWPTPRKICSHFERIGSARTRSARCKRIKYKAWGNAPGMPPHTQCALQAQKQCKPSAMSLLKWPRRSLFYVAVAVGVTTASMLIAETIAVLTMGIMDIMSTITPAATFAPVARQ